jgi:hypothetical protein
MSNTELINLIAVVVLGLIGLVAVVALAYAKRKGDDTLLSAIGPYEGIAKELIARLDDALVHYGKVLQPVNELVTAGSSLIDDDTDWLVRLINKPEVVDALRKLLNEAQNLTDGKPDINEDLLRSRIEFMTPLARETGTPGGAVHPGGGG